METKQLLGKAATPEFWQKIRQDDRYREYREKLRMLWEQNAADHPIVPPTYRLFREFFRSGDRAGYEAPYFARRYAMNSAALLALLYPEEPEYIERLMDEIYAICDTYTWCLPAHQGQIERNDNCHIDLFAAETGEALAHIVTLLGDRLDPLIRDRVDVELERRIFTPFEAREPYDWWETSTNNWSAVCAGAVACAFMLCRPERAQALLPRFAAAMECYLSGFGEDGICTEGGAYWDFGFGHFVAYAEMLRRFTEGEADLFRREKVRRIAVFPQRVWLTGETGVSFSDGQYHPCKPGLAYLLKREYPADVRLPERLDFLSANGNRFSELLRNALWVEECSPAAPAPPVQAEADYAPDAEWFIYRTAVYGFAAKGGRNDESHNHNDLGSFIYAKDGVQILCDPGAAKYTRQYFSPERYRTLEAASFGHSVPVVAGQGQQAGAAFRARGTMQEGNVFRTDIAPGYGDTALHALVRTFVCGERGVTVTDEYDYSGAGPLTERFVTLLPPCVTASGEVRVGSGTLRYDPAVCTLTQQSAPVLAGTLYMLDFTLKDGVRTFTLEME